MIREMRMQRPNSNVRRCSKGLSRRLLETVGHKSKCEGGAGRLFVAWNPDVD